MVEEWREGGGVVERVERERRGLESGGEMEESRVMDLQC